MKKLIVISAVLLFMMVTPGTAQQLMQENKQKASILNDAVVTDVIFDLNFINTPFYGQDVYGASFNFGVTLNDRLTTGIAMDFAGSSRIRMETPINVVNPQFNYVFFGVHNEFLINPKHIVNFSIPVQFGIASLTYNDRYLQNEFHDATVLSDLYLAMNAGVNLYVNITRGMSLGAGARYRFVDSGGIFGSQAQLNGLQYSVNIRFSMASLFEEE